MFTYTNNVELPNKVQATFHKIVRAEVPVASGAVLVTIWSWPSEAAYAASAAPVYVQEKAVLLDTTKLQELITPVLVEGVLENAQAVPDVLLTGKSLEQVKASKLAQINTWRWEANRSSFTFGGKQIACDELSRSDIDGVTSKVSLSGALPDNFPNAWKTLDNEYVAIPDVATWETLVNAMVNQGVQNFLKSQQLKDFVNSSTSIEDIEQLTWNSEVPSA